MTVSPCTVWCPAAARPLASRAGTWRRRSVTGASVPECADRALAGALSVDGRGYHTTEASTSALGRRFEGGEGRSQHSFGVARPLVELCLGGTLHRRRGVFHSPPFPYPRGS